MGRHPSIYALDTPGVLVPNIGDVDTGLKLSLTGTLWVALSPVNGYQLWVLCLWLLIPELACSGAVKDSVVGEQRIAKYLLRLLNSRPVYPHWKLNADEERGLSGQAKVGALSVY